MSINVDVFRVFILLLVLSPICMLMVPRSPLENLQKAIHRTFSSAAASFLLLGGVQSSIASSFANTLEMPMSNYDGLFCINFTVDANRNSYRAIVDTGSPFLIVPSVCSYEWGCVRPKADPKIADLPVIQTVESFGGQEYDVDWKVGDLKFKGAEEIGSAVPGRTTFRNIVFGSVGSDILRRPGGVFCGLIKNRAKDIKPSLLGQLQYSSFRFDTRNNTLTLSRQGLLRPRPLDNAIPMVDLRILGSPAQHYAAKVKHLFIDNQEILGRQIYAIIDTGTTGCVLSDDITYNDYTPVPPRRVRVVLATESGSDIQLEAGARTSAARGVSGVKPKREPVFVVSSAYVPWSGFSKSPTGPPRTKSDPYQGHEQRVLPGPSLVVLGMSFLRGSVLTVDIDSMRMTVTA